MTIKIDHGGQAFPSEYEHGMTMRDYFAAQALQGMVAGYWANNDLGSMSEQSLAGGAYSMADAMLEARAE